MPDRASPFHSSCAISAEKHYKLIPPEAVTTADLKSYQQRAAD